MMFLGCFFLSFTGFSQDEEGWTDLFDGKSLAGWEKTNFGGEGPVDVKNGNIELSFGEMLTGITWKKDFPKTDYEIQLEASRIQGSDFFIGLTFPVGESFCTLILGGWGGAVVGLSSIDGFDASENETTLLKGFKRGRWFDIQLRVDEEKIKVWIDDELLIDQEREGRTFDIRPEVRLSRPLGITSYQTRTAIRSIRFRKINP